MSLNYNLFLFVVCDNYFIVIMSLTFMCVICDFMRDMHHCFCLVFHFCFFLINLWYKDLILLWQQNNQATEIFRQYLNL